MITEKQIEDTIYQLYKQAAIVLGDDVKCALEDALKREDSDLGKLNIEAILKNIELAEEKSIPMCQDTGLPIIFVKLGKVHVENLYEGIKKGVAKATAEVPLRPNVVDPITRKNSGNVGDKVPIVDIELIDEDYVEFTIMPKGFGSENNNALKMALPAEGIEGVKDFVVETALKAGGKPCPPIVVGVGIGCVVGRGNERNFVALLEECGRFGGRDCRLFVGDSDDGGPLFLASGEGKERQDKEQGKNDFFHFQFCS